MASNGRDLALLVCSFIWIGFQSSSVSYATVSDIYCLRSIKDSLEDPFNYLNSSWNFNNNTEGFVCDFTGIECGQPNENKVLNIRLSGMGLKRQFPRGIENCTSLTGLDLSCNELSGSIPSDISQKIPYITSLDLSSNNFSGEIPVSVVNCTYLNVLKLDNNQLTGQIPLELGLLSRLKTFSVANNLLSGQVPSFGSDTITRESYADNLGLCGAPLDVCQASPKKSHAGVIAGAAVGGVTFTAFIVCIALY